MTDAGRLVLVATPIGNLGDLSPRAREVLASADVLCCEDTRRTRQLLAHAGVAGGRRLVSVHGHNEQARVGEVLARLEAGDTVALVSDAGTPAVSDPGARLVAAAAKAGIEVSVVPGPNAALSALVVSGLPTGRFCFEGFLPRRGAERRRSLEALAAERRTVIVYETAPRLAATLAELSQACGPHRRVVVARELTKLHEEIWRGRLAEAAGEFAGAEVRGELVIVLEGAPPPSGPGDEEVRRALADERESGHSLRDAADAVSSSLGLSRRRVYELGLSVWNARH